MTDKKVTELTSSTDAPVLTDLLYVIEDVTTTAVSVKKAWSVFFSPRVTSVASSATPTPNADTTDIYILTALSDATATFGIPTGTPVQGQKLIIRIKDNATPRILAWNAIYRAIGITLPLTTTTSKTMYIGFIYNSTDTKWDGLASLQEA